VVKGRKTELQDLPGLLRQQFCPLQQVFLRQFLGKT